MKRAVVLGAVVAAAVVAALGGVVGPDLLAAYRFEKALDRHAGDYQTNGGSWPQLQDTCALCHGPRGQSKNAQYASLAGLSASYIESQLRAFAEGRRRNPQMGPLAADLSDGQVKLLATYFARQTPDRNEAVVTGAALERHGQATVAGKGCAACHGDRLMGGPLGPRLAGQGEVYLADQLTAFKGGELQDPTRAMNGIADSLSEGKSKPQPATLLA